MTGVQCQCPSDLAHRTGSLRIRVGSAARRLTQRALGLLDVRARSATALLRIALTIQVPLDGVVQLASALKAVRGPGSDSGLADLVELRRDILIRSALPRRARVAGQRVDQQVLNRVAVVQRLQRQDLEQDGPQRVHVRRGANVIDLSAHLLRRHVARRTDQRAHLRGRQIVAPADAGVELDFRSASNLGHAPVEHIHLAEVAEHHVGRLQIAMHHATAVGEGYREAHLAQGGEQAATCVLSFDLGVALAQTRNHLLDGVALHALHGEVSLTVVPDADVIDRHHAGMLELPLHASFPQEARTRCRQRAVALLDHLHGDVAPDERV